MTGHLSLTPRERRPGAAEIPEAFSEHPSSELTGLSRIAKGADTIFAKDLVRAMSPPFRSPAADGQGAQPR